MESLRAAIAKPGEIVTTYFDAQERRQVVQAVVVGVVVWTLCYLLKQLVHGGFHVLMALLPGGLASAIVVIPLSLGALLVAFLSSHRRSIVHYRDHDGNIHQLNGVEGDGLERAIALYFSSEPEARQALLGEQGVQVRWRLPTFSLTFRKFAATLITLCSGGSGGLEASVALIGESASAGLFKPRKLHHLARRSLFLFERPWRWWQASDPDDLQTAQLCGIGAAIATLIGAPFASSFFAVEVMHRRRPIIDKLIYVLISSMVAFFLSHFVGAGAHLFAGDHFPHPPVYSARYYLALLTVAVTVAAVGIYFRGLRARFDRFFHHRVKSVYTRHLLGAVGVAVIAFGVILALYFGAPAGLFPTESQFAHPLELVLGPGTSLLEHALNGKLATSVAALALGGRFLATLFTITSGGSAGLLFPTLCFGTLLAVLGSALFGISEPVVLIGPAMTAALVSIANVPLAAILFVIELFGAAYVVPALFALVVASIIAHENNIYRTQRDVLVRGQILPGFSVRRVKVPASWSGNDLRGLDVRRRFGLTVIGMLDRFEGSDGNLDQKVVLNPPADQPLTEADILIVLGEDADLMRFEREASEDGAPRSVARQSDTVEDEP